MFQSILIALGRAGARRPAVHPAALFAANRRRLTGSALSRFRAAARAGDHGPRVARVIANILLHFVLLRTFCVSGEDSDSGLGSVTRSSLPSANAGRAEDAS